MAGEEAGFLLLAVGLIAVFFALAFLWHRRNLARWRDLGAALGLTAAEARRFGPFEDYPVLRGSVGARAVLLRSYTTGSGRSEDRWTALEAAAPAADPAFDLRVTREGLGASLAKAFGGQDVRLGNADFDARFRVQSSDPARAQRALGFAAQQALAALPPFAELRAGTGPRLPPLPPRLAGVTRRLVEALEAEGWKDSETAVRLVWSGLMLDPDRARAALPLVADLAEGVEQAAPKG